MLEAQISPLHAIKQNEDIMDRSQEKKLMQKIPKSKRHIAVLLPEGGSLEPKIEVNSHFQALCSRTAVERGRED